MFRAAFVLAALYVAPAKAESVNLWISSFQDKAYYEKMVEQYRVKVDQDFSANIQAFGFR